MSATQRPQCATIRPMATLQLPNTDARLTYLAIQYHLARPGSELDHESGRPAGSGLSSVAAALEPQLDKAVAEIELNNDQQQRLDSAIGGSINELKTSPLLEAGGRGTIPAFTETLRRLFPEAADDPNEALSLAGHMLQLRRRIAAQALPEADAPDEERQAWWQVWKRRS
ncbi:MAG: hypothetical protein J4N95_01765 [Chloroflexi bacterium]|nr:hypothetical protein [Chloroflexota bacterium]